MLEVSCRDDGGEKAKTRRENRLFSLLPARVSVRVGLQVKHSILDTLATSLALDSPLDMKLELLTKDALLLT